MAIFVMIVVLVTKKESNVICDLIFCFISLGAKIPESSPGANAQQNEQKDKVDDQDDESDADEEVN